MDLPATYLDPAKKAVRPEQVPSKSPARSADPILIPMLSCALQLGGPSAAALLQRGLLGYAEVLALQDDPALGCTAIQSGMKAAWGGYLDFFQNCQDYLDNNKTKQGDGACASNADCFTACDTATATCTSPSETDYFGLYPSPVPCRPWRSPGCAPFDS